MFFVFLVKVKHAQFILFVKFNRILLRSFVQPFNMKMLSRHVPVFSNVLPNMTHIAIMGYSVKFNCLPVVRNVSRYMPKLFTVCVKWTVLPFLF